eukprot:79234_1
MDGNIYLDVPDSNTFASYSSFKNKKNYSISVGNENMQCIDCKIRNITISTNLDNYYYDPSDDSSICFDQFADLGITLNRPIAVYWDETMYILDGADADTVYFSSSLDSDRISFETANNNFYGAIASWTQIQQIQQIMYIYTSPYVYQIDLSTRTTSSQYGPQLVLNIPLVLDLPCLTNNNTHLFIHSNYTIWTYHSDTGTTRWSEWTMHMISGSLPVNNGANCQIYQNKLYLFGGYNDSNSMHALDTIYQYDIALNSVHALNITLCGAAASIRSIQQNEKIYLFTGSTTKNESFPVQIFDAIKHTIFITPDDTFYKCGDGYFDNDKKRKIMV